MHSPRISRSRRWSSRHCLSEVFFPAPSELLQSHQWTDSRLQVTGIGIIQESRLEHPVIESPASHCPEAIGYSKRFGGVPYSPIAPLPPKPLDHSAVRVGFRASPKFCRPAYFE